MKIIKQGQEYDLWQLGGGFQKIILPSKEDLPDRAQRLISACKIRSIYLNSLQHCLETEDAIEHLCAALLEVPPEERTVGEVESIDSGHIYRLWGEQRLTFVKKSNELCWYEKDWPGLQTQEVMRLIIDLGGTEDKIDEIRLALFMYEVRAYRRKLQAVNTKKAKHDDTAHPRVIRLFLFDDIPFSWEGIELMQTGDDGHVIV